MKIMHIVGARPNFMKIGPLMQEMTYYPEKFDQLLVHTGQHYDHKMSQIFFDELGLPKPDINLEVGSGSHAWQAAHIMLKFEPVLSEYRPDWVVVPGDVNSTIACALVCAKLGIKIAHLEAGLRSFDRTMPEEINRLLTDQIADLLFTPSKDGDENLLREGVAPEKIHFVGNIMIDTLVRLLPEANLRWPVLKENLILGRYILVTLHRPSNVDDAANLREIILALNDIADTVPVIFPVHPRTKQRIREADLTINHKNLRLLEPFGYLDFLVLEAHASLVLTDSGGVQEETTYLKVPCLTLRPNTERPITIQKGTNQLLECNQKAIIEKSREILTSNKISAAIPELWDGGTASRIVKIFLGNI